MIEGSQLWIGRLATGVEVAAAVIVGLAALEAFLRALPIFLRRSVPQDVKVSLRLALGRWLGVGLELALAADILRTAVSPAWRDIGQLAAIAVLRTALNFTLEREIEKAEQLLLPTGSMMSEALVPPPVCHDPGAGVIKSLELRKKS